MADPNDDVLALGDINVSTAREANEHIDQAMAEKEQQISDLREELAEVKQDRDDYKEQAEKAADLLEEIQDERRQNLLARIQQANEQVAPDQEVDLSELQQANIATLEQVATMLDAHAEAANQPVSNTDQQPNLANVDGNEGGTSLEDQLAQTAEAMGLGRGWNQMEAGGFDGPELGSSTGSSSDDPADRLANAIRDITNSQSQVN